MKKSKPKKYELQGDFFDVMEVYIDIQPKIQIEVGTRCFHLTPKQARGLAKVLLNNADWLEERGFK